MFVSTEEAAAMTGRPISLETLNGAQALIEVYVGRTEPDIDNPRDLALLARATAFQAAYMQTQESMIYEQASMKSISVGGTSYTFPEDSTGLLWLAPIAKKACSRLSWTRSRSIKTGMLNGNQPVLLSWWTED